MIRLDAEKAAAIFRDAVGRNLIGPDDHSVIFYSTEVLDTYLEVLKDAFPSETLHAIAIKTNSSSEVLKHIVSKGFGLEAASIEEVKIALEAGIEPSKLVFDSPVKTRQEIRFMHEHCPGALVNVNSLQELERYPQDFSGVLGLRINPLVDPDSPEIFNVSTRLSKFGVPISRKQEIIEAAVSFPVEALHIHIGSGVSGFDAHLEAIRKICVLADEINRILVAKGKSRQIRIIDIGGGLEFSMEDPAFSAHAFVQRIKEKTSLFEGFKVYTEYGKFVHTHAAVVVSDIEYVVENSEKEIPDLVFLHVGADLFLRKVYSSLPIEYPWSVIRKNREEGKEIRAYQVVGPLCFAGDVLYKEIQCEYLSESDRFVIHDVGANTLSMWSRHCSRKEPRLIVLP